MTSHYLPVDLFASCVISAPIETVWATVRDWSSWKWYPAIDGQLVSTRILDGDCPLRVGCKRVTSIGKSVVYEQLVALEDNNWTMKWKLISHPGNINPFPAAFFNYVTTIQLMPVTVGNLTFFQWSGKVETEPQNVEGMKATLESMYQAGFKGIQEYTDSLAAADRSHALRLHLSPPNLEHMIGGYSNKVSGSPHSGLSAGSRHWTSS